MAEEKFADEMLTDDELDRVAGGYDWEIRQDKQKFAEIGIKITSDANDYAQLKAAFAQYGVQLREVYETYYEENYYVINGRRANHSEVWRHIRSQINQK